MEMKKGHLIFHILHFHLHFHIPFDWLILVFIVFLFKKKIQDKICIKV